MGKTTHIPFLAEYLQQQSLTVLTVREPGGEPRAEAIRKLLETREYEWKHAPFTQFFLMLAARRATHPQIHINL